MVIHTNQPQAALASLFYSSLPSDGKNPYQHATGDRKTNTGRHEHPVSIENIRGREELASLDLTGFQYGSSSTAMSKEDFGNDEKVKSVYYKEVEEALKKDTGASRIVIFDHSMSHSLGCDTFSPILTSFQQSGGVTPRKLTRGQGADSPSLWCTSIKPSSLPPIV